MARRISEGFEWKIYVKMAMCLGGLSNHQHFCGNDRMRETRGRQKGHERERKGEEGKKKKERGEKKEEGKRKGEENNERGKEREGE